MLQKYQNFSLQIPSPDTHAKYFSSASESISLKDFYGLLDRDTILRLYKHFEGDFLMDGYNDTLDYYLDLARQ